jgi:hypothetical protein
MITRVGFAVGLATLVTTSACGGPAGSATAPGSEPQLSSTALGSSSPSPARSVAPVLASPSTAADGTVTLGLPPAGVLIDAGDDALWGTVFEESRRTVIRIDPESNQVTTVLDDLPPEQLVAIGVEGSVWAAYYDLNVVVQYDAQTGEELARLEVGAGPLEPVYAFGDIWTLDHNDETVTRIDPRTSTVVASIDVANSGGPGPLTYGIAAGLLWVASPNTQEVAGIDPQSNAVVRTIDVEGYCGPAVAGVADQVWLQDCDDGVALDPVTLDELGDLSGVPIPLAILGEPVVVDRRVWVPQVDVDADAITGLVAVDLDTYELVDEFNLPTLDAPRVVYAFDSIWLSTEGQLLRIPTDALAARGG